MGANFIDSILFTDRRRPGGGRGPAEKHKKSRAIRSAMVSRPIEQLCSQPSALWVVEAVDAFALASGDRIRCCSATSRKKSKY
jgi:hypothetical protein